MVRPALVILGWAASSAVILTAAGGYVLSFFRDRKLLFAKNYLLYCALAGLAQLVIRSEHWHWIYWMLDYINNLFLCAVIGEVAFVLFLLELRTFVLIFSPTAIAVMISIFYAIPRSATEIGRVKVDIAISVVGFIFLIVVFMWRQKDWTRETLRIFWGVTLLLGISVVITIGWSNHLFRPDGWWKLPSQLAPFPGLVLLITAGRRKKRSPLSKMIIRHDGPDPKFQNRINADGL